MSLQLFSVKSVIVKCKAPDKRISFLRNCGASSVGGGGGGGGGNVWFYQ